MASLDHKLSSFQSYVVNYLHTYRKRYNKLAGETIALRFLVGNNDTVTIYCSPAEPTEDLKIADFWFSGSILRKCVGIESVDGKQIRRYVVCYKYSDAFASTIVSLNASLSGSVSLPPSITQNPTNPGNMGQGDIIKSGGGTMSGPLYLRSDITDTREATSKSYVDSLYLRQQEALNLLSTRVVRAESAAASAATALNQLRIENEDLARLRMIRVAKSNPALEWQVVHNQNSRYVIVQVYDQSGERIEPDTVKIINENAVRIVFSVPVAGRACLFLTKE